MPPTPTPTTIPLTPLAMLSPSPTNPRKRITQAAIEQLAASIAAHGLAQPILARPRADAPAGEPPLEIVAGERRWRACSWLVQHGDPRAAWLAEQGIPTIVRELTDQQVLALQLAENIQREDLHPLEEAQHYHRMRTHPTEPRTVADIAQVASVPVQRVRERLSLMQLVPAAVDAFMAERINLRLALQVARMPGPVQAELVEHLANWGGEPMGPKAAAKFVQDRYMLRLATAPFDPADATLHPQAGPCGSCLKRTGANPDLFGDVSDADTCTDTACFASKKIAQRDRMMDELADTGYTVLRHDAAREACAPDGRGVKPGWHLLEDPVPVHLGDATLKVVDVVQRAEIPNSDILAIDYPGSPVVLYALRTGELEAGLRRMKKHRQQLDKAAERAKAKATPAPAPAPAATPAPAAQPAPAGDDAPGSPPAADEPLDAFGQPLSSWVTPNAATTPHDAEDDDHEHESAGPSEDLVHAVLQFKPPAMRGGGMYGHQSIAQYTRQQEHRAFAILVAAQVVREWRRDFTALPTLADMAPLINRTAIEGGELCCSYHQLACLMGHGDPADAESQDMNALAYADSLDGDHAAVLAVLQLCLQETTGEDAFHGHAELVAECMDIDTGTLWEQARGVVADCMLLGAVASGTPAKPGKPTKAAKKGATA